MRLTIRDRLRLCVQFCLCPPSSRIAGCHGASSDASRGFQSTTQRGWRTAKLPDARHAHASTGGVPLSHAAPGSTSNAKAAPLFLAVVTGEARGGVAAQGCCAVTDNGAGGGRPRSSCLARFAREAGGKPSSAMRACSRAHWTVKSLISAVSATPEPWPISATVSDAVHIAARTTFAVPPPGCQ